MRVLRSQAVSRFANSAAGNRNKEHALPVLDARSPMSNDLDAYRCPKCGATSALMLHEPVSRQTHVALKCLQCAHVLRMPRHELENPGPRLDFTSSLE